MSANQGWRQDRILAGPLTSAPKGCLLRVASCPIVSPPGLTGTRQAPGFAGFLRGVFITPAPFVCVLSARTSALENPISEGG